MRYYEAHITMEGAPYLIKPVVEGCKWKFSQIAGDAALGDGVKCYATRHYNERVGFGKIYDELNRVASILQIKCLGCTILRRKIELVMFDSRSDKMREVCEGNCPECVGE